MDRSLELGYVGVEVSDQSAFDKYLRGILGLMPGEQAVDGVPTYRMDSRSQRIIVHNGPNDDIAYAGFVATDRAAYDTVLHRLEEAGYPVTLGTDEEKKARRVHELAHTTAPWGTRVEIAHGLAEAATPFSSELVPGGFVTGGLGLGHAVFAIAGTKKDFEAAEHFATAGLGMALSDYMESNMKGLQIRANFYHCNGRHHTLAQVFVPLPEWPKTLDHIMIETVSEDNVGHAFDRAVAADVPITRDLGKHPNDRMFSFYSVSPAGFQFEFGVGGIEVDDDWEVVKYDSVSAWGHHSRIGTDTSVGVQS
ncbi:VOC family protein [Nocardia sp. NPDC052278]|uniref:VOC family protein n=1 Tax=unclassified Nocardia TaxID=2637762 RepID=UPI0036A75C3C